MIYILSLITIILDQLTKGLALFYLPQYESVPVFPTFNLFLTYNKGVSFSFLTSDHPMMPWALSAFALIVCILIVRWMRTEKNKWALMGLALILGGAIGNVIDRIRFGAVVDFLDFYIGTHHWPAFNIADSAICIGVALIFIGYFKKEEKK